MGVNKVVYGGETVVDLTNDTVTPETLSEGVTAHDASGALITGTMKSSISESGGSASTGYYIKFEDGTMICYKRTTIMPNAQTSFGGFYRSDYISLGNFPAAFTALTYIKPEIWYANYSTLYMWCTAAYGPSTTSAGSVAVISNSKFSSLVEVMYTAIGRWK